MAEASMTSASARLIVDPIGLDSFNSVLQKSTSSAHLLLKDRKVAKQKTDRRDTQERESHPMKPWFRGESSSDQE
jgi:hypothetical protein